MGKTEWVWVAVDKRPDLLGFPAFGCFGDWNKMANSVIKEIPLIPSFRSYTPWGMSNRKYSRRQDRIKFLYVNESAQNVYSRLLYARNALNCSSNYFFFRCCLSTASSLNHWLMLFSSNVHLSFSHESTHISIHSAWINTHQNHVVFNQNWCHSQY